MTLTNRIALAGMGLLLGLTMIHGPQPAVAEQAATPLSELLPPVERQRKTDRTYVFTRSQVKYGLEKTHYLSRWVDRPLFVDPDLQVEGRPTLITLPSFERTQQIMQQYGLDGMAFFPETSSRVQVYERAKQSSLEGFYLLNEMIGSPRWGIEKKLEVAGLAAENPASFRIDGKVVFTTYTGDSRTPTQWADLIEQMRQAHGDQFLVIVNITRFGNQSLSHWLRKYDANTITKQDVESVKEYLRSYLRVVDGLYIATLGTMYTPDRRFHREGYENFFIPVIKSVLAEPEFKDKYFALAANSAHENATRLGYVMSSDGTKTLRNSFEAAMQANPDVINLPEWDEQNENTSFRPTVYNGLSTMRIMRYYTGKLRGTLPEPLPDDDTTIPNAVVSYRKLLVLGEPLEIEVLHVPDAAAEDEYTVTVSLTDLNGQKVYESPAMTFEPDALKDHTLSLPSEQFADHQVLRVHLKVQTANGTQTFSDGLHYIELRPTWNWDYKWVKQPLRDLLPVTELNFQASEPDERGRRIVQANIQADEPLAYVDVLDNDDVIYMHHPAEADWRTSEDRVVLMFEYQTLEPFTMTGSIELQGATGEWRSWYRGPSIDDQTLVLTGSEADVRRRRPLLAIPRDEVDQAVLHIDMEGIYTGEIRVADLLEKQVYGISGPEGFNLVMTPHLRQLHMPPHLDDNSASFTIPVQPDLPSSVLHLQAVGKSGRTYRSQPVVLDGEQSGESTVTVYSADQQQPVEAQVDAQRVADLQYRFTPEHGSVLACSAGRAYWGILGGYAPQATGRGGGEARDGTPFLRNGHYPADATQSAPDWVELDDGSYALQFDGEGTFVTLPQGAIPRRAGFTVSMRIKPDHVEGKQVIFANRAHYPGLITVYIEDGVLKADLIREKRNTEDTTEAALKLPAGQWSDLRVHYDQHHLVFEVNGQTSQPLTAPGPGLYDMVTAIGGFNDSWFAGMIQDLRIQHWTQD